jgi:hypothetical protein
MSGLSYIKRRKIERAIRNAHALGPTYTDMREHNGRNNFSKRTRKDKKTIWTHVLKK